MPQDHFNWDNLKVFRIVAELGSLSATAKRLNMSVPTVSRRIAELEKSLSASVIRKTTNGVTLTNVGEQLYHHTMIMADQVRAMHDDVADADVPAEGPIHLVTGDGLGPYWIAPRLAAFHHKHPKIELHMTVMDDVVDAGEDESDIRIQFRKPKSPDRVCQRLGVLHYLCFASQDYIDRYGEPNSVFEFPHHRCLAHSGYIHQVERWAPKTSDLAKLVDHALITNSAATMISVCENGGGIAVLPSYINQVFPKLVPLKMGEIAPIQFWMTFTERVRRLPRGRVVIDFLQQTLGSRNAVWFRDNFVHPALDIETELQDTDFVK